VRHSRHHQGRPPGRDRPADRHASPGRLHRHRPAGATRCRAPGTGTAGYLSYCGTAAAGAGCALILATTAALTASIAPSVVGGDDIAARALGSTLGQWPAAAAVIGCTTLLAGTLPRLSVLAWLPVAASAALALLGDLLEVPGPVQDLGFFGYVPDLGGVHPSPLALLVLTGLGVAACLAGLAGTARRDVLAG
jgi:ABC-2 type transport system permease protein